MKYMYLIIAFKRKHNVAKRKYNKSVCFFWVFRLDSRKKYLNLFH